MVILLVFPRVEERIYRARDKRTYEVTTDLNRETMGRIRESITQCGLRLEGPKLVKSGQEMVSTWEVYGSPEQHDVLVDHLMILPEVKSFHY
jgi:hypothetical protein